jgi:uncharacterized membrane protein
MTRALALPATLVSLVLTGGIAGFFYAYSVSVMPGLDRIGAPAAIEAMQGINAAVRNPVFFVTFFLTPVFTLLAAAITFKTGARVAAVALALAALVYIGGAVGPTAAVNVPLNEALAGLQPRSAASPGARWTDYAQQWTIWNHIRTLASTISLVLVGWALAAMGPMLGRQ